MRLDWHAERGYEDIGGLEAARAMVEEAAAALPREHLREIGALIVLDDDPKGKSLGIWRQDHTGVAIEIYLAPHVTPLLGLPPPIRDFALRLHLAYTVFHEVGHHVTRYLNRRAAPPRRAARVEQKIERWADEYAEKRLARLVESWQRPGDRAEGANPRRALLAALRAMRLDTLITLADADGTKHAEPAS